MGEIGDAGCKRDLLACLDDSDEEVRVAGVEALELIDQGYPKSIKAIGRREMRVFISSTFQDMQKERDLLIRRVFPEIRQLCHEKGVGFTEVDLRWGITEQQAERGEVLPVCMAEIENSRPYFIGLLGERYGSVPHQIPPELVKERPWLQEHQEASITELEILHGVLNDPSQMNRSFFYFRDPSYIRRIPVGEQSNYVSKDETSSEKLKRLKDRIRDSGVRVVENYADPEALCRLVMDDLTKCVNTDFPFISMDVLDQEIATHKNFAENRRRVFIRQPEVFEAISLHIQSSRVPLVLMGDSGIGKSTLLANWAETYRAQRPSVYILEHYIGITPQSTDYVAIQRRIMGELKRQFHIQREVPTHPKEIRSLFPEWLQLTAEQGKFILILDGLNQLEDRDNAPDLPWLPDKFPSGAHAVLSTVPGRSLEAAQRRAWQTLQLKGLETTERKRLVYLYLSQYHKRLNNRQVDEIVKAIQTANPLYLKVLLDELRTFGIFEKLDDRSHYYLQSETVGSLYEKILNRLEMDYEYTDGRKGLVEDALTLIWAARDGLSENEILTLLGQNGGPLPRAIWSPLYLAIQDSLINRAGYLTFFHTYFKEAVEKRYLPQFESQKAAHRRLGQFFERQPVSDRTTRELPWQWLKAEEWPLLSTLMADLTFFPKMWESSEYEVKTCWTAVEAQSDISAIAAYQRVLDAPREHLPVVQEISILFHDLGHISEAVKLREFLVDYYRMAGQKNNLAQALTNLAILCFQRSDFKGANSLIREAETYCRDGAASNHNMIATGNMKAALMKEEGNLSSALEIWGQLAGFCREKGYRTELQSIQDNMAAVLFLYGKWDEALELYRHNEQASRELGNKTGLLNALVGQANVLCSRGRFNEALELIRISEPLCRDLGDKATLLAVLSNQAIIYQNTGNIEKSFSSAVEQEKISRELGDQKALANALIIQAINYQRQSRFREALSRLYESERICRQSGNQEGLHSALANQAIILRQSGLLDESLRLQKEVEQICRTLGDLKGLQTSLGNQANILSDKGDLVGSLSLNQKKVAICRQIGFVSGLALGLTNAGVNLLRLGRVEEALDCAREAHQIAQQHQLLSIQQQAMGLMREIEVRR